MTINPNSSLTTQLCRLGELKGWQNRVVLGVSSIATQPFIDYHNKNVDEETRKYSAARTTTKIIVGTAVGSLTRWIAQKDWVKNKINESLKLNIKNEYMKGFGEILAITATVLTTVTMDGPLTNLVLNKVLKRIFPERYKKGGKKCHQ